MWATALQMEPVRRREAMLLLRLNRYTVGIRDYRTQCPSTVHVAYIRKVRFNSNNPLYVKEKLQSLVISQGEG
jgi:hypothetical protein